MPTVLIVDDSPLIRLLVTAALGQTDLVVQQAAAGSEALAICQAAAIDVVLLDVEMPGENGFNICQVLKSNPRTARIRVIVMSGHASEALDSAPLGPDYFLAKPFSASEVQAVIQQALGQA